MLLKRFFSQSSTGSMINRVNIGIFGAMNAGKSTLMNLITQQPTSIVDKKPGTTADTKIALMEIHSLGPVKLFDTAGLDEIGPLGLKKKEKTVSVIKETDLVLLIIDPTENITLETTNEILQVSKLRSKKVLIIYNIFADKVKAFEDSNNKTINQRIKELHSNFKKQFRKVEKLEVDLSQKDSGKIIFEYMRKNWADFQPEVPLLPSIIGDGNSVVFLNIPMDEETPSGRLLRPQAMAQEFLLRNWISTFAYRMDLKKARSPKEEIRRIEKERFLKAINSIKNNLSLLVTDSQAIDIIHPWTLDSQGNEIANITTFSIMMANYMSGGKLNRFIEGLDAFSKLKKGDKVLICEACNHDRILDDIGTKQIPDKIKKKWGENTIEIDFAFGREYQNKKISDYKVALHCGGCMIDKQKMSSRLQDLTDAGVPITNYGIVLSYFKSDEALKRVLKPWIKKN
ncbi:atp/gtp-binding protein-related [Anaeramoeba ignava]|uniref:Atp/gtp-binding protein-related n=1 Tax=Anaeramoeba ignava TaxID=1746090 RepID=A0A9Q0LAF0_ANAIG|nr:atp/gtp-binding protein-related [Anaeramoeba ignava]|eukprot:Anaeramoba_ignava/a222535_92.p1 GENE.a222535_92~~a222535_92.p1  ORF type:complete len:456 (-),score=160.49 a222535_92:207-1574(-)